jgi:hypothetical protein
VRARVSAEQAKSGAAAARAPAPPTLRGSVLGLHRRAGNRAVGALLRGAPLARKVGWSDAVKDGYAWNADERLVGKVRRIPLADLPVGLSKDAPIGTLTTESAERRAIVLVPVGLDAKQPVEYVVFLHGHTEDSDSRPFAGYRAFKPAKGRTPKATGLGASLRHGIDATDVAPVRDVALDQAEAQLEASGLKQVVIILAQGGLYSQFEHPDDSNPTKNFDAPTYVTKIAERLLAERVWKGADDKPVTDAPPPLKRITMAGHSGAGATLGHMADESRLATLPPGTKDLPKPTTSSPLPGDLVIFDAINGSQLGQFQKWVQMRLDKDLEALQSRPDEKAKLEYLRSAPKLRGYYSGLYASNYAALEKTIRDWFKAHASELGPFARCLRANFMLEHVAVQHEEQMRGLRSGSSQEGGILEALQSLHSKPPTSAADCPKMPEELEEEARQRKLEEQRRKREEQRERRRRRPPAKKAPV